MRTFAALLCLTGVCHAQDYDFIHLQRRVTVLEDRVSDLETAFARFEMPEEEPAAPAQTGPTYTGTGTEILYVGADWCGLCGPAKARLTDPSVVHVTLDEDVWHPLLPQVEGLTGHIAGGLPFLAMTRDGRVIATNRATSFWGDLSGWKAENAALNRYESAPVQTSVVRTSPMVSTMPRGTMYTYPMRQTVRGYCPTCR